MRGGAVVGRWRRRHGDGGGATEWPVGGARLAGEGAIPASRVPDHECCVWETGRSARRLSIRCITTLQTLGEGKGRGVRVENKLFFIQTWLNEVNKRQKTGLFT